MILNAILVVPCSLLLTKSAYTLRRVLKAWNLLLPGRHLGCRVRPKRTVVASSVLGLVEHLPNGRIVSQLAALPALLSLLGLVAVRLLGLMKCAVKGGIEGCRLVATHLVEHGLALVLEG